MNKRAYIFYLSAIIVCFISAYKIGYDTGNQNKAEGNDSYANANVETKQVEGYWIKSENGVVVVYEKDKKTIVATTEIVVENLPEEEQKVLKNGHYFETAQELFGFLESYTS